ncbi:Helicase MOV-10 [Desmophyllum pertusum]|uniref:Helicase MOV-10 n=1 Tax=Desmophyllum pertusum TaxID=174260 RepID=A0A9W9YVA1_9CNID|nr:Helicase MOV-10 [Desmophyllum pertusum]
MGLISTGCQRRFRIGCKRRREYGYSYVPGVLTFETKHDMAEFHILRFLSVRIVSDLYDDLKQTTEYRPPQRAPDIPRDVRTTPGIPLPALTRNGLIMPDRLDRYEIPFTVKAQVVKSNQVREGLR